MKMKKKAVIAAVAFAATMNLSACAYGPPQEDYEDNYNPSYNQNENAYGPPPEEYEETDTEIVSNDDTTQNEEETSYDPDDNINADVYGPPIE